MLFNSTLDHSGLEEVTLNGTMPDGVVVPPRLKVLVCAYACSPTRGSEYGVGWGWVEAISQYHELWVLTGDHTKNEVEAELSRRPELKERIHFNFIPRKRYLWAEKFWPPAYLLTYEYQWLKAAYDAGMRLHREVDFDIVHQLTYVGFRVPGHLWKLDVPFVWGPIGGLEQTPWSLIPSLGVRAGAFSAVKNVLNDRDRRFKLGPKRAFAKADGGVIAATKGVQAGIKRFYGVCSEVVSEIGIPPLSRDEPSRRNDTEPLSLIWCGNLIPTKTLPYLLSALAILPASVSWKLSVIGRGPCMKKWQRQAEKAGVADRCEWLGEIPRQAVLERMQTAHALIITSIYDLTSTVLVEALANGLPVVCPDHCGFSDAITPDCGIKVAASSVENLVLELRDAIVRLYDESVRRQLAHGAIERSYLFEWKRKAAVVNEIYMQKSTRCHVMSSRIAERREVL